MRDLVGYAYAAGEEDTGAVGVQGVVSAIGSFNGTEHGDDSCRGGFGFVVEFCSHAGAFAHDEGDGG